MPPLIRWLLRLGPTNPIAVRLVQNGSKRMRHFYIRAGYLAALIVVLLWYLLFASGGGSLSYRDLAAAGASTFAYVAYLQVALICVLAPVFMAGAIAQEANPRTWEVLLTTPMSRAEIVLGNLFGRWFFILALLVASLPLFAMTQYFGGVPGRTIMLSYLIAGCLSLLVGAIAIALSVSRMAGRRAVFAFYVTVVAYLFATWAIDAALRARGAGAGPNGTGVTYMTAVNPFLAINALLNPSTYPRAAPGTFSGLRAWLLERPVSTWCWVTTLLSVVLMGLSTLTVRSGGLASLVERGSGVPWYRRMFGLGAKGAEHRPPRTVWQNPIAWREAAARNSTFGKIVARWSFIGAGGVFGVLLVVLFHVGNLNLADFQLAMVATIGAEVGVISLVAINMSATAVSREREDGTLDLLLTTPITPANYLSGKLRGLIAYLLPMLAVPTGTLAVAGLYVLFEGFGRSGGVMVAAGVPAVLPEAALVFALVVVPFTAFCCMVGLNFSLKSKGTIGSVVATVGLVGVVAGIVGACAWSAGSSIPAIGPVIAALSPASTVYGLVYVREAFAESFAAQGGGLTAARVGLAIGAIITAGVYVTIVYAIHAAMVRTFDFTVRKLAGTK